MRFASSGFALGFVLVSCSACATTPPPGTAVIFPPDSATVASAPPASDSPPQSCREFQQKIVIDGKEQPAYGTACLQPDGSWRVVAPATTNPPPVSNTAPSVNPPSVAVVPAPYPYYYPYGYGYPYPYPYPYPYYPYSWGPRFSFGFGYRGHWH